MLWSHVPVSLLGVWDPVCLKALNFWETGSQGIMWA